MTDTSPYIPDMPATAAMTAEDLLRLKLPNKRSELVSGRLVVREPAGFRHGEVAARMLVAIGSFVYERDLGKVCAAETGFTLFRDPDTVRAPDVAFVRNDRLTGPLTSSFAELAPDLAVEVLSPSDRPGQVLAKVADWLNAGSRLVWLIDPERALGRVYRADGSETFLSESQAFDGEDVLPSFSCSLLTLLA